MRDLNDAREVLTVETRRRFDLDYVPQPCNPAAVSEEQVAEARAAMRRVYRGLYETQSVACRVSGLSAQTLSEEAGKEVPDMALRGKKPSAIQKRLKALFFGAAGVGKTTAAIQFPRPYLIDTERGAENDQYVRLLEEAGGVYFHTTDFDEMTQEVKTLMTEKHNYATVVIDPLTVPYAAELDNEARRLATREDPSGTAYGRHKQLPDRKVKHLVNLLLRLDMNVIITSHAKAEWKDGKPTGVDTFDCYSRLEYIFDLVFQIQKRGQQRVGIVRKTRVESFQEGDSFPFTYAEVATRYGREVLERRANAEALASDKQVAELRRLIELLKVPADTTDKWREKALAETWEEMPADAMQKCIDHLTKQIASSAA